MLKKLKFHLATKFKLDFLYSRASYSQEGEDLIICKYFHNRTSGFYVDIGAYHPYKISNTYLLHKRGWTGVNIDPNSEAEKLFLLARPRDLFLNHAISNQNGEKDYYKFSKPALNTLSIKQSRTVQHSKQAREAGINKVKTIKLSDVLKSHAKSQKIDFINIDVEGEELNVLNSNVWKVYNPELIAIENARQEKVIDKFLNSRGYAKFAQTSLTGIYLLSN